MSMTPNMGYKLFCRTPSYRTPFPTHKNCSAMFLAETDVRNVFFRDKMLGNFQSELKNLSQ